MARLAERARPAGKVTLGTHELDAAARQLAGAIDPVNGGLRGAPKFPQASLFEMLWRAGLRSGDARFFDLVDVTLERICEGGIYDHLGGGFSRYSVDDKWLVPHFEKMLYDNAQLLELLALAWQRGGNPLYRQRARETVAWLQREMTTPDGGLLRFARCGFRGRGRKILRLVAAGNHRCPGKGRRRVFRRPLCRHRRGQFRRPQYPQQPCAARAQRGRRNAAGADAREIACGA